MEYSMKLIEVNLKVIFCCLKNYLNCSLKDKNKLDTIEFIYNCIYNEKETTS